MSTEGPAFLLSQFPVALPYDAALTFDEDAFDATIRQELAATLNRSHTASPDPESDEFEDDETATLVSVPPSTVADISGGLTQMEVEKTEIGKDAEAVAAKKPPGSAFIDGLKKFDQPMPDTINQSAKRDLDKKMSTLNGDLAFSSTKQALVDLFFELEVNITGPRLRELLAAAWHDDPLVTLKIIFNARSIHTGKASREPLYRCSGWLAQNHPLTLVSNLKWLVRPVIAKPSSSKAKAEAKNDDFFMVDVDKSDPNPESFDAENGLAHGYWKDLLNILALAANGKLDCLANVREVINVEQDEVSMDCGMCRQKPSREEAKEKRDKLKTDRHARVVNAMQQNSRYRVLHLTVARLFAQQLKVDLALLRENNSASRKRISMCGKWAPSQKLFHDKHTFIVTSIAEILYPLEQYDENLDRTTYIRYARESYRKDISALRQALRVVERDISAGTFSKIYYDRVPSAAMNRYASTFMEKDEERFDKYLENVAVGKKKISGATLFPSTLIKAIRELSLGPSKNSKRSLSAMISGMDERVLNGQWRTLVQRIKDSGSLADSIAVCDVSRSMNAPLLSDHTTPMDSAIGLSLLVAEVTKPPFGGNFITFSTAPDLQSIDLSKDLRDKYKELSDARWEVSTDLVKVFTGLILPMAVKNKLKQEDMVKQVFVFSDMQFDRAEEVTDMWSTSFERITKSFVHCGYEVPKLIFWNLAGANANGNQEGSVAPKPVDADQPGVALVSGYSQGMLKMFLQDGSFDDLSGGEEDEIVTQDTEDGEVRVNTKKQKTDPLASVLRAVSHPSYAMLKVLD